MKSNFLSRLDKRVESSKIDPVYQEGEIAIELAENDRKRLGEAVLEADKNITALKIEISKVVSDTAGGLPEKSALRIMELSRQSRQLLHERAVSLLQQEELDILNI